jgi:ribosomal protein L21E
VVKVLKDAKVNGSIIPTRDYQGFTGPVLKAGTTVVITDIHTGVLGRIIAVSVRHPKTGKHFRRVPVEVFER